MVTKKYNVTDELISSLYEGQSFKNFKEMCVNLNVLDKHSLPLNGNSKKQFLSELERFVEIEKVGKTITIKHIRSKDEILPALPAGGNVKYSLTIQQALVCHFWYMWKFWSELYKDEGGCNGFEILWCKRDIMYSCRLFNEHFSSYGKYGADMTKEEIKDKGNADAFRRMIYPKYCSYVDSALNTMHRNREIILEKRTCFIKYNGEDKEKTIIPLTPDQKITYLRLYDETLRSYRKTDCGVITSLKDIYAAGKAVDFYGTLKEKLVDELGTDATYVEDVYDITIEPGALDRAMIRLGRPETYDEWLFLELNNKICNGLLTMKSIGKEQYTAKRIRDYREMFKNSEGTNSVITIIDGEKAYFGDFTDFVRGNPEFYFDKNALSKEKTKQLVEKMVRVNDWGEDINPYVDERGYYPKPTYYQKEKLYQEE